RSRWPQADRAPAASAASPRSPQATRPLPREMSAAGPPQGTRPLGGTARSDARGDHASARRALVACVAALIIGSPAQGADMTKTLHVAFAVAENGFDPQAIYDTYSDAVCSAIFDPLYTRARDRANGASKPAPIEN